jgi:hypothetical protein
MVHAYLQTYTEERAKDEEGEEGDKTRKGRERI